jgi:hypothetical protein
MFGLSAVLMSALSLLCASPTRQPLPGLSYGALLRSMGHISIPIT